MVEVAISHGFASLRPWKQPICPSCQCGALFVDLSAAFSSITRHLVFPVPDSMDNLFGRLCECEYLDAEATEIIEGLTAYSYWNQSGGSKHLLALIGKLHIGSWFSLRPLTTIFESCRGALAGSSLGDVLFLLGFARVMNRISAALENQRLIKSVPLSEEACAILPAGFEERFPGFRVPLCSSQYMDDVVAAVVYGEFHKHLLRMNMKQRNQLRLSFASCYWRLGDALAPVPPSFQQSLR